MTQEGGVFVGKIDFGNLLFQIFFKVLFFFFCVLGRETVVSHQEVTRHITTCKQAVTAVDMPVYGFRYGGKQITFRQIEFFQFVQFMIQTGGSLEMDASLVSVKAGLHIDQVVFGTFLEMFVIAFLLQLFCFQEVTRVVFVRNG